MGNLLKKPIEFVTAFSKYTATEQIGEGGSGRVYKAVDESGDTWAIKTLDQRRVNREKMKRFKNEYIFCSKNTHRNIIAVCDNGIYEDGGISGPFYVMPLYNSSLRKLMVDKISSSEVLHYFGQIIDGLEAAHMKNVVHRDIKPENILVNTKTGELVIADFGIAHFSEDELYTAVETKEATRLANFQYAAPEQRRPGQKVDSRTDIYALGLILNEMFTGEVPQGAKYKTVNSVEASFGYLDSLIEEMIAQSMTDRIPSIEEVKRELIGRGNEFINRQEIDRLTSTVISTTDIADPIFENPIRLIDANWKDGILELKLSQWVNSDWEWAFRNMGSYSSVMGKEPQQFSLKGNTAVIPIGSGGAQAVIDYFKQWLPQIQIAYKQKVENDKAIKEERERKKIREAVQRLEHEQNVNSSLKI